MADYYVREEDGTSKYTLEDGSGSLLLESSVDEVDPSFISSVTVVNAPTLSAAGFTVGFISSVTSVFAPTLQALSFVAPFISSVTVVHAPGFPGPGFNPISEDFIGNPAEFENKFGQGYDDFGLEEIRETHVAPSFIHSHTVVYTPTLQLGEVDPGFIASATAVHAPTLGLTGSITISVAGTYTWVCPSGISTVYVECYGGGGGGGDSFTFYTGSGGGGGGGAYSARVAVPVTPGNSYTFVVGAAGGPGTIPNGGNGVDGGSSTFTGDSSVQVIAVGGSGAHQQPGGAGGAASSCTGDTGLKFSGGDGGTGTHDAGSYGGGGGASGNHLATGNIGADGTSNPVSGGAGANGGGSGGSSATTGSNPGGGGGGNNYNTNNAAAGADGRIAIQVGQIFPTFIASDTLVYTPTLEPHQELVPFIPSVTVVYTATLTSTLVLAPFISSVTQVYQPTLRVSFTGGGVSQVAFEVLTSGGEPNANVSQVTLEILVPWYDGLHVWERTGGT